MIEQTSSRIIALSKRHTSVELSLTFTVEFPSQEYPTVEIRFPASPTLIDSLEPLSSGIRAGVHDAVQKANLVLPASHIKIDVQNLDISQPIETLDEEEIVLLGKEVRAMMYESLSRSLA